MQEPSPRETVPGAAITSPKFKKGRVSTGEVSQMEYFMQNLEAKTH